MSNQLTDSYLATNNWSDKQALKIAALEEPLENPYLRRIWRNAFLLACTGHDHFVYQTSHMNSTVWVAGDMTARVTTFDIDFRDSSGLHYTTRIHDIDGRPVEEWIGKHS
jgi:hypothetical protein